MTVEKMKVIGVIGRTEGINKILKTGILDGSIHMIDAFSQINSPGFKLPPTEKHLEALEEIPNLRKNSLKRDFSKDEVMVKSPAEILGLRLNIKEETLHEEYDYDAFMKEVNLMYEKASTVFNNIDDRLKKIQEKKTFIENLELLKGIDVDIGKLCDMKYLLFKLLKIPRENYLTLKRNYENIPAVVSRIRDKDGNSIILSIAPKILSEATGRIFKSLNCIELKIPNGYYGSAVETIDKLMAEIKEEEKAIENLREKSHEIEKELEPMVQSAYSRLQMEKQIEEMKSDIAFGKRLFFMFGFVPGNGAEMLKDKLEMFEETISVLIENIKNAADEPIKPPTKLKNNWFVKPFETLIKMYGIPSYGEKDPTPFFAITYMLLFGAMFGDLGQGFVIFAAGAILAIKLKATSFGGVLERLGLASMIFGALYGSVFGAEDVIPAVFVRPMADIKLMLTGSVVLGVILLTMGFAFSLINSGLSKNVEEGVFGRNGLAGFLFYCLLIMSVASAALGIKPVIPQYAVIVLMLVLLLFIFFRQPLAHKLANKPHLYDVPPKDYYIEEGFGILETLLSMLSNTISFIRVGAFALNHVGLFIAFSTMAKMINSRIGGIFILIIGNIVIIGLEGLIVFIQGLRLEYYELFSKYYTGDGVDYTPVKLAENIWR